MYRFFGFNSDYREVYIFNKSDWSRVSERTLVLSVVGQHGILRWPDCTPNTVEINYCGLTLLPCNYTRLRRLQVDRCWLEVIPPEIGQLKQLGKLSIRRTPITSVPAEIGQLTRLTALDLNSNLLSSLPPELGLLSWLRRLDVSHNPQLRAVPLQLGWLDLLEYLSIYDTAVAVLSWELLHTSVFNENGLEFGQTPLAARFSRDALRAHLESQRAAAEGTVAAGAV